MVLQMANLAENCDVTMVLVLQMADNSFATSYKRYEINSVNKVYTIDRGMVYTIRNTLCMRVSNPCATNYQYSKRLASFICWRAQCLPAKTKKTDHIELRHVNRIMIIIPSVEPSNFTRFGPGPCSII